MAVYTLRTMVAADLPAVLAIEERSHLHPWSAALFSRELENPLSTLLVAETDARIVGYLCVWLVAGEAEIHNVATDLRWQRQGVGRFLMTALAKWLVEQRAEGVFLEVRAGNQAANRLYERCGFVCTARRTGYYHDGEDALLMACTVHEYASAVGLIL